MLTGLLPSRDGPAGIQYVGLDGVSMSCLSAVANLVQRSDRIERVRILTCDQRHALLITFEQDDLVAVKAGFGSGYMGEGPAAFSEALQLLQVFRAQIDEYKVTAGFFKRLGLSSLTCKDLAALDAAKPIRPMRLWDYILERRLLPTVAPELLNRLSPQMPWAIIDPAIVDLALDFFAAPDKVIMDAFRRLEDTARQFAGLDEYGSKLFSQAFYGDESRLEWAGLERSEQNGRAQLFTGGYQAYRNPRAHRTLGDEVVASLAEFLVVNQLFRLLRLAKLRDPSAKHMVPAPTGNAQKSDKP